MSYLSLSKPILFLDILTGDPSLRRILERKVYRGNSYAEIMRQALGVPKDSLVTIDASIGEFPNNMARFSGLVIGGSTEDPVAGQEKAWVKRTYPFLRRSIRSSLPILGICGGLEFVVRAMGGAVIKNPRGREFGTTPIRLTSAGRSDPLFRGLPRLVRLSSSHRYMARNLPLRGRLLATNGTTAIQALAIGDHVRLLQFHLEMRRMHMRRIANLRYSALRAEGFISDRRGFQDFLTSIDDTLPVGAAIFRNWIHFFVCPKL